MGNAIAANLRADRDSGIDAREPAQLSGRWLRAVHLVWYVVAGFALAVLLASLPGHLRLAETGFFPNQGTPLTVFEQLSSVLSAILSLLAGLAHLVMAAVLFRYKSHERIALVGSFYLLTNGIINAGPLEILALHYAGSADFVQRVIQPALSTPLIIAFLSLFPDGRFVPRWTCWLTLATVLTVPLPLFVDVFALAGETIAYALLVVVVGGGIYAAALYAQIYRYRHVSSPAQRQQTKWVVFGLGMMVVFILISSIPYGYVLSRPEQEAIPWWFYIAVFAFWWPAMFILPITLSIAILRYRLWDIDIIINRSLVYTTLTAIVVGIYILVVGSLGTLIQTEGSLVASLVATGIVAVSFQPLRERLQRAVNRLLYGERDDPYPVLGRLAQRLETVIAARSLLPTVAETVADALKLPYAAIALRDGDDFPIVTEYAREDYSTSPRTERDFIPLVYQSQTVGQLILAPRGPGEQFSRKDRQLLETIAHHTGIVAYNVLLTQELQRSRERLVTTREEERRRVRHDLHDDLGPELAAMSFKLDSIDTNIEKQPQAARDTITDLKSQMQIALASVRELAYALRPPALDELGLIGAVEEQIAAHSQITLVASQTMPHLTAAVEVAAYRIMLEALDILTRHASGHHFTLRVSLNVGLHIAFDGHGDGLPADIWDGETLVSMRERAEELGGSCLIESASTGGSRLVVRLPLPAV